ncbi:signal peptidase I [Flavobacterium sp. 20NA77.7]|uniref:Signal peptidase I n=1 Tax=Flavobacterium nakdongensis TaxID=3073563 RepID=A0ABY9RDZ5_9FLAO|nr:signal peptidase I [Flavobacterium sp. 20NA77.7]WMW78371.1 signal peptidase I [Flavobacterium sp. 20NA77.7]
METTGWILAIIILSTLHGISTWKLYTVAGKKAWEAFIPVYNGFALMQLINRPKWWVILIFIPIINLLLFPVIWIEILRTFGKKSTKDMWLGVLTLGFYITYVNYTQQVSYEANRSTKPATKALDTLGSLSFAIIVATLVHSYFIQPFVIPTSSLEKSLLVGDFLFVSKFHYGARTPMTTVAAPMVHDTIPLIKKKSYSSWPQLPYFRLPGLQKIERNDIVVFNWPVDTVAKFRDNSGIKYYKPIDKKSNYVKRCVGIPGDVITIKNSDLYVNNKLVHLPERAKPQFNYIVKVSSDNLNNFLIENDITESRKIVKFETKLWEDINFQKYLSEIKRNNKGGFIKTYQDSLITLAFGDVDIEEAEKLKTVNVDVNKLEYAMLNLTAEKVNLIKQLPNQFQIITKFIEKNEDFRIFPHTKNWTQDNLGPIKIPTAGETVKLNTETLPFYKMIITEYEHHKLQVNGNEIRIDGKPVTSYTFEQNYYWMMGDNRHNSEDSRYWGFVPEDHIVGKPVFIWMSIDWNTPGLLNKFRPERIFTTVSGEGEPKSYFKYFLGLVIAYYAFDYFRNKKKKEKEINN